MNLPTSFDDAWRIRTLRFGVILLMLTTAQTQMASAFGGELCEGCIGKSQTGIHQSRCCPDDYSPKPVPCVRPVSACCLDTFCRKPCLVLPCRTNACCPDDYCPKPFPETCRTPYNPWYKCISLGPLGGRLPGACAD